MNQMRLTLVLLSLLALPTRATASTLCVIELQCPGKPALRTLPAACPAVREALRQANAVAPDKTCVRRVVTVPKVWTSPVGPKPSTRA